MAYCPKCAAEMEYRDTVCPQCGYDFPAEPVKSLRRTGIAYSVWADVALMVGGVASGLTCVLDLLVGIALLVQRQYFEALIVCPLVFFLSLAMLVVFLRVQKL